MNELDLQSLVCDIVNDAGGFAFKSSNRFLLGVSDLFVKLPPYKPGIAKVAGLPGGFIEVKQRKGWPASNEPFDPGVTVPQRTFLKKNHNAGVPTGVLSFIQSGAGSGLTLHAALHPYISAYNTGFLFRRDHHVELGRKGERENALLSLLYNWHKEWKEGL